MEVVSLEYCISVVRWRKVTWGNCRNQELKLCFKTIV